jgi:hypothetical protein
MSALQDRPMAEPSLNRSGVVALVGERVAAGVAQHVRVRLKIEAGGSSRPPGRGSCRSGQVVRFGFAI